MDHRLIVGLFCLVVFLGFVGFFAWRFRTSREEEAAWQEQQKRASAEIVAHRVALVHQARDRERNARLDANPNVEDHP